MKPHLLHFLKAILCSLLLAAALLCLMALILYKTGLSGDVPSVLVLIVDLFAVFTGGFLFGKGAKRRRFLWGAVYGLFFFLLLLVLGVLVPAQLEEPIQTAEATASLGDRLRILLVCVLGGMAGGMLS